MSTCVLNELEFAAGRLGCGGGRAKPGTNNAVVSSIARPTMGKGLRLHRQPFSLDLPLCCGFDCPDSGLELERVCLGEIMSDLAPVVPSNPRRKSRAGTGPNGKPDSLHDLLHALQEMRGGNFSVRMSGDHLG